MIISKTPFRMSFFGGGTDYPEYFCQYGGQVLSTTFDKYCYISCRYLPPFFEHKHRIVYSIIENVKNIESIKHPAVRSILQEFDRDKGFEIHYDGDLPARSGLGSSSSFIVGLVNAMVTLYGRHCSKKFLAEEAIRIEQKVMKDNVGSQDQIAAAYGGFNQIIFKKSGDFVVQPIVISTSRMKKLEDNLLLFFTGTTRTASEVAKDLVINVNKNLEILSMMNAQVLEAIGILKNENVCLDDFGRLLDRAWFLKKSLSQKISSSHVDQLYDTAKQAGAIGGKLLGAGGGGFVLFYVKPTRHDLVIEKLKPLIHIPFKFESEGSKIVFGKK